MKVSKLPFCVVIRGSMTTITKDGDACENFANLSGERTHKTVVKEDRSRYTNVMSAVYWLSSYGITNTTTFALRSGVYRTFKYDNSLVLWICTSDVWNRLANWTKTGGENDMRERKYIWKTRAFSNAVIKTLLIFKHLRLKHVCKTQCIRNFRFRSSFFLSMSFSLGCFEKSCYISRRYWSREGEEFASTVFYTFYYSCTKTCT